MQAGIGECRGTVVRTAPPTATFHDDGTGVDAQVIAGDGPQEDGRQAEPVLVRVVCHALPTTPFLGVQHPREAFVPVFEPGEMDLAAVRECG